jgi:O-antigen ligase
MNSGIVLRVYLIFLFGIAPFLSKFSPSSYRLILWSTGFFASSFIIVTEYRRLYKIPIEFYLYFSLLIFAIISLPKIEYYSDFFRYLQVLFANFILMISIYFAIHNYIELKKVIETIFYCLVMVVGFSFITEGSNDFSSQSFERLEGLLGNSNGTASYARISILFGLCMVNWSKNIFKLMIIYSTIILCGYVIILSASRSSLAIFTFVILSYLYFKYLKNLNLLVYVFLVIIFLGLIGTFLIEFIDDFYVYERLMRNEGKSLEEIQESEARLELYKIALEATLENPILGLGLNQFRHYAGGKISHTDILDIASQLGLIAMIFYVFIYVKIFNGFKKMFNSLNNNLILKILFLLFLSEIIFGLSNPNWFLQIDMALLSLFITYIDLSNRSLLKYKKYLFNV